MRKIIQAIALGLVLGLAGCAAQAHDGPYGGHTSKWYANHPKQDADEAKWCDAGSTRREDTKTCNAAYQGINEQLTHAFYGSKSSNKAPIHVGHSPLYSMKPIPLP
jgi:hypothetical protein